LKARDHQEFEELLGAYALDAVDTEERDLIEQHIQTCPRCRLEVSEHKEAIGLLTRAETSPEGIWNRIEESLEEPPPGLKLEPVREPPRARLWAFRSAVVVGATTALLAAFLALKVNELDRRLDVVAQGGGEKAIEQAAQQALVDPNSMRIELKATKDKSTLGNLVLKSDGEGYLVDNHLRDLPENQTYQLWGLMGAAGATKVSLGILGRWPRVVSFRVAAPVEGFAITEELAPGVEITRNDPIAIGWLGRR
jgi:anti-sigma-K factor RskA